MRSPWTRTGQRNFWIMGGALAEARLYSRPLALQLKADLEGLITHADQQRADRRSPASR